MALNNLGLGFIFTAKDLASGSMRKLEVRFKSLDEQVTGGAARMDAAFKQIGVGLALLTAGAVVLGGAFALGGAAGKFEQGIAAVGAVASASEQQLAALREAAIAAGIETQFSPTEAVEGLQSLATAGQTVEQSIKTLNPVLDLAAGSLGQLGVAQAAEAVVGTLNAYGKAAAEAGGVTDKLLRITQLTNFQTRDFEAGLSKAAAAGAVFNQSLDDTLITMGLLRNRNIDASSASTAFRESVRRVGSDSRAQQAILGAGVKLFDEQTGQMRSIVDVMSEFATATAGMTDKERSRRVVTAFGARGLLAFNAIQAAAFTTMRDGALVTLQGAEAVEALREKMAGASGTAATFREKLLDTFEGQKTLLSGTLATLGIALGEPFAAVFKPIVAGITTALNGLLQFINAIPAPVKQVFAGLTLAVGTILTLVGGTLAASGAATLFVLGLKALGVTLAAVLAAAWPVVAVVGALAGVVSIAAFVYRRNLGGLGDLTDRVLGSIKLGFSALGQLFSEGAFSGAVMEELNRAENGGLKRFVIGVFQMAHRLGVAWEGIREGFLSVMDFMWPIWQQLGDAVAQLGGVIGDVLGVQLGQAVSAGTGSFRTFGQSVGVLLGGLLAVATGIVTGIVSVVSWFAGQINAVRQAVQQTTDWIERKALAVVGFVADLLPGFAPVVAQPAAPLQSLPASGGESSPAVAETRARVGAQSSLEGLLSGLGRSFAATSGGDVNISLVAEGETLARVSHEASRDDAARSFSPVPTF